MEPPHTPTPPWSSSDQTHAFSSTAAFFFSDKHQTERRQETYRKDCCIHAMAESKRPRNRYCVLTRLSPVWCLIGGPATKDPGTELFSLIYYFLPPTPPIKRASRCTHQAWITRCLALDYTISERHSPSRTTAHLLDLPRSSLTAALAFSLWLFLFSSVFFPSFVHQSNRSNYFPCGSFKREVFEV